jgi:hypothetical protein
MTHKDNAKLVLYKTNFYLLRSARSSVGLIQVVLRNGRLPLCKNRRSRDNTVAAAAASCGIGGRRAGAKTNNLKTTGLSGSRE